MIEPFPTDPLEVIPHRPPMLFIDEIVFNDGGTIVARREARSTDRWEGALIEGLAQTAAVLGAGDDGLSSEPLLVGLKGLSVRRLPEPGEELRFNVGLVRALLPLVLAEGQVDVVAKDGSGCEPETIAEGQLKFYVGAPA